MSKRQRLYDIQAQLSDGRGGFLEARLYVGQGDIDTGKGRMEMSGLLACFLEMVVQ